MPRSLPYMPLYVGDYKADTAHLTAIEHGAYLLLLMHYWQRGRPLPADDDQLRTIAMVSPKAWPKVKRLLSEFFEDDGAHWTHQRVEKELERSRVRSDKARESGIASGAARRNERSTNVQRTLNERSTDAELQTNYPQSPSSSPSSFHSEGGRARKIPADTSDLYDAVLDAMALDHNCSQRAWGTVQKVVARFAADGRTPEFVRKQAEWFRSEHWVGKRGEPPSADQLIDTAIQFARTMGNGKAKTKPLTPEQVASFEAQRAKRAEMAAKQIERMKKGQ